MYAGLIVFNTRLNGILTESMYSDVDDVSVKMEGLDRGCS